MKDDSGHFGDYAQDDLNTDLDSMKIWAPWSSEQTFYLNTFQRRGNFHPFTCPQHNGFGTMPLIATMDGWVCPVTTCDYTQDWAWIAMLDANNWRNVEEMTSFPPDLGCRCQVAGEAGNWYIQRWNPSCELHPQLQGTVLDPAVVETQQVQASRPLHMAKGDDLTVMKTVGVPKDEPTWTGLYGMDPHYDEFEGDDIEVHFTKADLQALDTADLVKVFPEKRLRELMPNFTADQQMQLQAYWKGQVTPSQLIDAADSLTEEK